MLLFLSKLFKVLKKRIYVLNSLDFFWESPTKNAECRREIGLEGAKGRKVRQSVVDKGAGHGLGQTAAETAAEQADA